MQWVAGVGVLLSLLAVVFTLVKLLPALFRHIARKFSSQPQRVLVTLFAVLSLSGMAWPLLQQNHDVKAASASPGSSTDPASTITSYTANYRIADDGNLLATEVVAVELPEGRHGIFRFFPAADPTDPHARLIPVITGITMDGGPVPVDYSWRAGRSVYVAQIGDPNTWVSPGVHTYTIDYTIDGVLVEPPTAPGNFTTRAGVNPTAASAVFYYNVFGFWAMKAAVAHVEINLPGPSGLVQCAADQTGATPCTVRGAGTDRVTVTSGSLPPQNPVTVRVDLPVPLPQLAQRVTLPWTVRFDRMLGRSVPAVKLVAVLSVIGAALGYLWARRSREPSPGMPVLYVPPDGLGPVQAVYITRETIGRHALVATLLYLAERGLVRLDRADSKHWTVTGIGKPTQWAALDQVSRQVGEALGLTTKYAVFHASGSVTAGEKLSTAVEKLKSGCSSWARTEGFTAPAAWEVVGRVTVIAAVVFAIAGFSSLWAPTVWGLPFAAFAIAGTGLLVTGVGTRRTRSGRELWSRAGGLQRLLSTPSSEDRFDFAARKELFTAYIPYAVAFGVADRWAAKYRTATGQEPPIPGWYPVRSSDSATRLYSANGFAGFDSAVSASITAYHNSQLSSSSSGGSSFRSSGGSWGGGGGGGGGTW